MTKFEKKTRHRLYVFIKKKQQLTWRYAIHAMHWTPEGKRKRGRPKITWRRTVEKEIKEMGKTWEGIKFMARDRQMWREHVAALHAC